MCRGTDFRASKGRFLESRARGKERGSISSRLKMILRTPPPRKRRAESVADHESPVSDRRLVPYVEPSDDFVCSYQCRQMVKSEFVIAMNTAEKKVVEYESKLETLTNELNKSEQECERFRQSLLFLEQQFQASKGRQNALQEQLLKESSDFQERYHTLLKRYSELETQLKKEVDMRNRAELVAENAKVKASTMEEELRTASERNEKEKGKLQMVLSHLEDESKLSIARVNAKLERMKIRANTSEKEAESMKKSFADLQKQLSQCLHEKSQIECMLSRGNSPVIKTSPSEHQTLVKHLQDELRYCVAELQEARKLKSSHLDNEFLKEQLLEERGRQEKGELELSKLREVEIHAQKLECELTSWKSLLKEIPDVSCYDDVPKKIAQLQKETIENMLKVGEANARLKEMEVSLESANIVKEQAEKECNLANKKAELLESQVNQLELMLSSASEECEKLKRDAIVWSRQKSGIFESEQANETAIKNLEMLLEQREHAIRELENHLNQQREVINREHEEVKLLNEMLSIETRKMKSLEREGDRLRSEISLLESKLGHGDYLATNTKVLRMVNTLGVDSEAKRTIEVLQAELQKAQAKLQAIEELKGQSANVLNVDIPEKLAQLKGQIAVLEKREERYKAVFAEKISIFRRACCSLFGYKIVMDEQQRPNGIPVTRFTLQSIYAQNDDEKLEFEYESGNVTIMENDYTSQPEISRQVEIFVRKMNSVPAFTANLTVESFDKRTLS
ncbi:hypothetical protein AXF42_Ash019055 [Apostasia shenzhenica]|uniref:Mitotic spindle checkpoint protein MAD1 n=1 Tax=Apostasia shenzhenica TaxID=1088818 RepID=A0A2I0BB69_9ASPA|nr:hypothetical protein AXF42_Ash019055 [Apostasia shenzhenica]